MIRLSIFAIPILFVASVHAATVEVVDYARIFPVGAQDYTRPITELGLDWEADNLGWNSDYDFDTAGWSVSVSKPANVTTTSTPSYGRIRFLLDENVASATFTSPNEGSVEFYLNGNFIGGVIGEPINLEVSEFLKEGENLLATKGHRTWAGAAIWFTADIDALLTIGEPVAPVDPTAVPLPAALPAGLLGLLAAAAANHRRKHIIATTG